MYRSHWNTKIPYHNETFSSIKSSQRFGLLMSFFLLNDSTHQPEHGSPNFDWQYKIRPFLDKLVHSFQTLYTPYENISVDDTMIGFKVGLSWVKYMPKKPTRFGIKALVLAGSKSGYVWNLSLYTGTQTCIMIN